MSQGLQLICVALVAMTSRASADDKNIPTQEFWGGIDATTNVWLFYSGITLAPWGKGIFGDGWRLRAGGGYGQYYFARDASGNFANAKCGGIQQNACRDKGGYSEYRIDHTYADLLVGYQKQFGDLTAKGYVGLAYSDHRTSAPADIFRGGGTEYGIKGALEFWLNLGAQAWTSLDLSYSTTHETASARWRAGWRVLPDVSIGPEVRYDRNDFADAGRIGMFARQEWPGGEVSLAAGAAGEISGSDFQDPGAYVTLNVLFQY